MTDGEATHEEPDALRASPELARRYADLKESLARTYEWDREAYTEAKGDFVAAVLKEAR